MRSDNKIFEEETANRNRRVKTMIGEDNPL